jgi:Flp pilus assembly pilin Flp
MLLRNAVALARDEQGGLVDYALITAVFALIVLISLRVLSHGAGGNLSNTSTNLTNMAVHS